MAHTDAISVYIQVFISKFETICTIIYTALVCIFTQETPLKRGEGIVLFTVSNVTILSRGTPYVQLYNIGTI